MDGSRRRERAVSGSERDCGWRWRGVAGGQRKTMMTWTLREGRLRGNEGARWLETSLASPVDSDQIARLAVERHRIRGSLSIARISSVRFSSVRVTGWRVTEAALIEWRHDLGVGGFRREGPLRW